MAGELKTRRQRQWGSGEDAGTVPGAPGRAEEGEWGGVEGYGHGKGWGWGLGSDEVRV